MGGGENSNETTDTEVTDGIDVGTDETGNYDVSEEDEAVTDIEAGDDEADKTDEENASSEEEETVDTEDDVVVPEVFDVEEADVDADGTAVYDSDSNDADEAEEIIIEADGDDGESAVTVTIPIPYEEITKREYDFDISEFWYATDNDELIQYELPSNIVPYGEVEDITISVPLDEDNKGTLRFKTVMKTNRRLDRVMNGGDELSAGDDGIYTLSVTQNTRILLQCTKLYPVIFEVDEHAQVKYYDRDEQITEPVILTDSDNTLSFVVIPEEGYVVRSLSSNSVGITVKRNKVYDHEVTEGRIYSLYLNARSKNIRELTKVFITVEKASDYTLTFDYPENMTSVSVEARYGENTEILELIDKSVEVDELKSVYFDVKLNDVSKAVLVRCSDEEVTAILSPDSYTEEIDSGDGNTGSVIYRYSLGSLTSNTSVSISVVDKCIITFEVSYGISRVSIFKPLDKVFDFEYEGKEPDSIITESITVPVGSQLVFSVDQDLYEEFCAQILVNIKEDNDSKLTNVPDDDGEPAYMLVPTENTTITLGVKPAEFIFDYDETEVELFVYDQDFEEGTQPLKLSENKGIDCGHERDLRIKVKPIKENKRLDLKYNSWDEGAISPGREDEKEDGYYYYFLNTGDSIDHRLTITCYNTCSITFQTEGNRSGEISLIRVRKCYYDDEWWEWEDDGSLIESGETLSADIDREFYFKTGSYETDECKQICTITTGGITSQLEVYSVDDSDCPIYRLIPTGDTTVVVDRSELQEYKVTVEAGEHVTNWSLDDNDYSNGSESFTVKENHIFNLYRIKVDNDYKSSVTYIVGNDEQQEAKAIYGRLPDASQGIYYQINITGDTTVKINAEQIRSYMVVFENADELESIEYWAGSNLEKKAGLKDKEITIYNNEHYYFSVVPKDGTFINSVVCIDDSGTETVLEEKTYFFGDDDESEVQTHCYEIGGGYDVKGDLTIKVNLSEGYTIAFDTTQTDGINVYSMFDYVYNIDGYSVNKKITSKKIGLPVTTGYSFFFDDYDEYDVAIDSASCVLTKDYGYRYMDGDESSTYFYSVIPKKGVKLPQKVTVSITERVSKSHTIKLDYPETIRSISVGSYEPYTDDEDGNNRSTFRIRDGAVTVDDSLLTLILGPVSGYTASVTIKGDSDPEPVTLTPYRNCDGLKEYYIGSVTEDKTITITASKGVWTPASYWVGFLTKKAQIMDSVYKTPFEILDEDLGGGYYVTKGESISFYVNPIYGYAVEGVFAGGVEIIPEWDETLWKYVYTVTPDKDTTITVNTVNKNNPNEPVGPNDPIKPDDPTNEYVVTFSYPEAVKSISFKDNAYTLNNKKITVSTGTEVAFIPEPVDGYRISSVKANGSDISADGSGYYNIKVTAATEVVISAVKESSSDEPEEPDAPATGYDVTFNYPETIKSITFKDNAYALSDKKITVPVGTEIAFKPEPVDGYKISSVTANSEAVSADDSGYYVMTISAATEIDITAEESTSSGTDVDPEKPQGKGIEISGLEKSYVYTGSNIIPEIKVWDLDIGDGKLLAPSTDYTLKYKNNKNVTEEGGSPATITVVGKGNYAGLSVVREFRIVKASNSLVSEENLANLKGAKIDTIAAKTYTGEYLHPDFTLTLKRELAKTYRYDEDKDNYFELQDGNLTNNPLPTNWALSNNRNKGTATLLLTGADGTNKKPTTVKKTFKINAVDLSKADNVTVKVEGADDGSIKYSVNGATPKVEVKVGDTTLREGTDYTVKYSANKKATDSAKVTVTGKGNYAKKPTNLPTFKISQLNMNDLEVLAVTAYDGIKVSKVKATVGSKNSGILKASQYTITIYKVSEDGQLQTTPLPKTQKLTAGDRICVVATAKDKKNLVEGSSTLIDAEKAFTVGKNIAKAKFAVNKDSVTNKAAKMYTGYEIKLADADLKVTIKEDGTTKTLHMAGSGEDNECYEIVEYTNNINKGTAKAVIRGINGYSGTKTVKFKIVAQSKKSS